MDPQPESPLARWFFVPMCVSFALLLRLLAWPFLGSEIPFLFLWPAVMLCAWYGGLGPGLLATLLSAPIGAYVFFAPHYTLALTKPSDWVGLCLFLVLGGFLSALAERLRRARRQIRLQAATLFRERERLRVTLGSIGDAVLATDADGRVTYLNAVAQGLTGWGQEEARGVAVEEVFHLLDERTGQPAAHPVARVLRGGSIAYLDEGVILRSKSGAEVPVEDSAAPIRCARGQMVGAVVVFRDATLRRTAQAELRQRAEQLVQADHRKDEFLALLAHELRNPLGPIRCAGQVVRRAGAADPELRWAGDVIERQVRQAARLVEDLLDVSRIRQGKAKLERKLVDLADVVAQAVESSRPLLEERSHRLAVSAPPHPVWVKADPVRLTQVVTNLLNNAAKYTEEGGTIELAWREEGREGVLRVRDSGIGIAAEMLPRVFDLFTQDERALPHARGGLGIGLGLVRKLVELHGGTVQAFSDGVGRGSEFVVRLPLADDMTKAEKQAATLSEPQTSAIRSAELGKSR